MKKTYKSIWLIICISLLPLSAVHATISDNIYMVFIWNPTHLVFNPRWIDQFEFDAGDVFRVYTTREAELTGTWIETTLGTSTWFQAYVEKKEETTTTTPATTTIPSLQSEGMIIPLRETSKYDVNLWGLSFQYVPPAPFDNFGYSIIIGYGAYLGVDSTFLGIASIPGPGEEPSFGNISPSVGIQEQNYTPVTITGVNTKFQDDPPVKITFTPADGLTISNVNIRSNTKIEFDLAIATTAPTGFRSVTVTYDKGSKIIAGANVFEVKAK